MARRLQLHSLLLTILGTPNVYFQPVTPNITLKYPCIVYNRDGGDSRFADNDGYFYEQRYQVTYIDPFPDSDVLSALAKLPKCTYQRWFSVDNLNHDVFQLYY